MGGDCKVGVQCKGNQVVDMGGSGFTIHIPHHKVAKKWGGQAITFKLPKDPQALMVEHLGWAHKVGDIGGVVAWVVDSNPCGIPIVFKPPTQPW